MFEDIPETYQIIGKIGSGNSGVVYQAYHKNLKKYVVLKQIKSDIKDFVDVRAEADLLKHLHHTGLPQVLDFLTVNGDIYTVMDFIPGNSFKQYLDAGRIFPEKSVMIWMKQMCSVLCYLHGQTPPIVHGDIKPGNIMLTPEGNICLIDFNISATLDSDDAWIGGYTKGYAAPEQISAFHYNQNESDRSMWKNIDARSDIYSLGATIYHILTGVKPEADPDGYVEDIRENMENINDVFAGIIMKCLEPDPEQRYQTSKELMSDLQNISQKDKRYRALVKKQRMGYCAVLVGTLLFCGMAILGYVRMGKDKVVEYEKLIQKESRCVSEQDYDNSEIYYEKAVKILPDRLDAYYEKAVSLSQQRRYGDCIDFINSQILSNSKLLKNTENIDGVYCILGDAYENMEDYERAADCYEKAVALSPLNGDYYRNYAIILARKGDFDQAEEILGKAKENGLDSVNVNYVEGEILFASSRFEEAKNLFSGCISQTQDNDLKMRAYLMTAKSMENLDSSANGKEEIASLLEQARGSLPKEYNIGILEKLAGVYSELGNMQNDTSYYEKAIAVFEQIKNQGMEDYETEYNLSTLYQNMQEYGKSAEILSELQENYGENYRTYKGLAFLEVAKQAALPKESRSYKSFSEYYKKAQELYQEQLENNVNDMEMQRLEDLYNQAVQNGWLN